MSEVILTTPEANCLYRGCGAVLRGNPRKKYCSRECGLAESKAARGDRRIYSMEEIFSMEERPTSDGYVNRCLQIGCWVAEHVLVMESTLGLRLPPGASVHHINGDRADNDPANLELWAAHHPTGGRIQCPSCGWPNLESVSSK